MNLNSNSNQTDLPSLLVQGLPALRWLCLLLLLSATAAAVIGATWQIWYTGRIFPGVTVAEVPLSGLTPSAALVQLREQGIWAADNPVLVTHQKEVWVLSANHEVSDADLAQLINEAYVLGRTGDFMEVLAVRWQLIMQGKNLVPEFRLLAEDIDSFVDDISQDVAVSPREAIDLGNADLPARPGIVTDVENLRMQIELAASKEGKLPSVPLEISQLLPDVELHESDLPFQEPIVVTSPELDLQFALDGRSLLSASTNQELGVYDDSAIRSQVQKWAALVDREPQNVRIFFNPDSGVLEVTHSSLEGVTLDVDATVNGILTTLQNGGLATSLRLNWILPELSREDLPGLGIETLVGRSETYFKGSSSARVQNIDLTTQQFASILIAPGEVFSFNGTIGPITVAAGYADAAVIWGDRTAIGVGGGVCQVSTAIFRAALNAGLPIEERHNHGYVVSWYGQPGMDATIYTPYVDLKFRNDTPSFLLLQPDLDVTEGTLAVNLFGTPSGRTVQISEPVISKVTEPALPIYVEDRSLAPGETKLLESEKLGLTVVVDRHVTENGITISESFTSVYRPWQAVYLEGPAADTDQKGALSLEPVP